MTDGGKPVEVLLAEDHPGDAKLTRKAFERENILNNLHIVGDGVEAMKFLRQEEALRRQNERLGGFERDGRSGVLAPNIFVRDVTDADR
ncbi:MAG: hypothetical protein ABEJ78_03655 [Haloferacaceae archaeon]